MTTMKNITTTMSTFYTSFVSNHPSPSCVVSIAGVAFLLPWYWKPSAMKNITTTITTLHIQNSKYYLTLSLAKLAT
jgi:hypothetical protein